MRAFISYTREKDRFQAVSEFRDRLETELRFYDPGAVVFQDRSGLQGGENFPERLREECIKADVMMIYLTPAWLQKEWCRHEFELFTNRLTDVTKTRKVLPMLTVDTPQVSHESSDPIARALTNIQYIDIRQLRHLRYDNPDKLAYVAETARRLHELANI